MDGVIATIARQLEINRPGMLVHDFPDALFEELEAAYWDLASGNCLTSSGASSLTLRSA